MSQKTECYRTILELAIRAQDENDEILEEYLMSKLDKLWLSMTSDEIKETDVISAELKRQ